MKRLNTVPLRSGTRQDVNLISIQYDSGTPSHCNNARERNKTRPEIKEIKEIKTSRLHRKKQNFLYFYT